VIRIYVHPIGENPIDMPSSRRRATISLPFGELPRAPFVRPFWTAPHLTCPLLQFPGHRSSAIASEHRRAAPFSPPHHRQPSPVRTPPSHLARCNPRGVPTEHTTPWPRRCVRGQHKVTAPGMHAQHQLEWAGGAVVQWARPTVPGLGLESRRSTVRRFSDFQFLFNIFSKSYKLQKYIENTILRKIRDKFLCTS
jgi:hypothetical protein